MWRDSKAERATEEDKQSGLDTLEEVTRAR